MPLPENKTIIYYNIIKLIIQNGLNPSTHSKLWRSTSAAAPDRFRFKIRNGTPSRWKRRPVPPRGIRPSVATVGTSKICSWRPRYTSKVI